MTPRIYNVSGSPVAAALADRARMPWRFLARHVTVDGLRR
jgi:hypothetical protein